MVRRERLFSRRISRRVIDGVGKALIPDVFYADVIFGVGNGPFSCSEIWLQCDHLDMLIIYTRLFIYDYNLYVIV